MPGAQSFINLNLSIPILGLRKLRYRTITEELSSPGDSKDH